MMNLNIKSKKVAKFLSVVLIAVVVACQPDQLGKGNGLTETDMDAGFTITEVSGTNNTYLFTANKSYITSSWVWCRFFYWRNYRRCFFSRCRNLHY